MNFFVVPVFNIDGSVLLYDMYKYGHWVGSRRTFAQCQEVMRIASLNGQPTAQDIAKTTLQQEQPT